jgi:phospholipase C
LKRVRGASLGFVWLTLVAGIVACSGNALNGLAPNGFVPFQRESRLLRNGKIKHVVIVVQENRSFDNFFATFPGADGTKTGKAAAMPKSIAAACASYHQHVVTQPTSIPLTRVSLMGDGFPNNFGANTDLYHIYSGYRLEYHNGAMNGFDLTKDGANGTGTPMCTYPYQYVNPTDIAPYWDIAKQYVLADHAFQTQASSSFTGHQDLIAGGTQIAWNEAIIDNPSYFPWGCDANKTVVTAIIKKGTGKVYRYGGPFPCLSYTTLRDLLDAKSVSWKFYAMAVQKESGPNHGDTPGIWSAFDAIKAVRYSSEWRTNVTRTNLTFFSDVSKHQLPAVSWITPDAVNSDHPEERSDTGPSWVASIVNAIGQSSYWNSTAIVVLWDDWGGFYDHATPPPPRNWQGGPGFRVPMLIVAAYTKPHVEHTVYQFGSVLKFVEDVFQLGSLGTNDQQSTSIGNAFDFRMSPRKFKAIQSKYSLDFFLYQTPSGRIPDPE